MIPSPLACRLDLHITRPEPFIAKRFKIADDIIGGGISGLAAAHRLLELSKANNSPIHLTLLEASPRLGGIVQTTHRDGFLLERGPDSFISEKPEALELVRRLGIESQLIQTNEQNRRSFIVRKDRLRPVPEGFQLMAPSRFWPFLTTDIFSLTGKAAHVCRPAVATQVCKRKQR
jgi:oxygen-dependent protoporphyrinogen oxidase